MGRGGDRTTGSANKTQQSLTKNNQRTGEHGVSREEQNDGVSNRHSPPTPKNTGAHSGGNRCWDVASDFDLASSLEECMRRSSVDEAWDVLEEMQARGAETDKYTVSRMLMKTIGDGHVRLKQDRMYRGISLVEKFIEMQPKDVDEVLFNALLDTCCRLEDLSRLEATVERMRNLNVSPSPATLGIIVKSYGQARDLQKVLQVWSEMEKQRNQANAVTYGCMIDACVKCGNLKKAVDIFKGMKRAGKHRNTILYTTLIKGYGLERNLDDALQLFEDMLREGVPRNTITYNTIIDVCIKCGDLSTAESLFRDMTMPGSLVEPDLITFSTLLKGYCNVAELDKALEMAECIKARGLRCDELVYNTLMDGCVKAKDIAAGFGLFEEMIQSGMRPSAITHNILARIHQCAGYEGNISEALAQLYKHHGVDRPSRSDRGGGGGPNTGKGHNAKKWKSSRKSRKHGNRGTNRSRLACPSSSSVGMLAPELQPPPSLLPEHPMGYPELQPPPSLLPEHPIGYLSDWDDAGYDQSGTPSSSTLQEFGAPCAGSCSFSTMLTPMWCSHAAGSDYTPTLAPALQFSVPTVVPLHVPIIPLTESAWPSTLSAA